MSDNELNPGCNFPNLANLSSSIMSYRNSTGDRVQNKMQKFLESFTENAYDELKDILGEAVNNFKNGDNNSLRILLAIDDGTVAFDTSREREKNTFSNFNNNLVNSSNHNTRPEVLVATLGNSGVGVSERYSKSLGTFQKYQANRIGGYAQSNLGTFRVSLDKTRRLDESGYNTLW